MTFLLAFFFVSVQQHLVAFRLQQAHHSLNIPKKFELVVAPKARLTSLFWLYLSDPFALAQLELDWHSQLFEAAHKILAFGGSKLLDCPSCLVQPQPQCFWVCKKQFFCWFSSLAWSFAGAFRHLLEFLPTAGSLPAGSCTLQTAFPAQGSPSHRTEQAQKGKLATLPHHWKGKGLTQHTVRALTDSIPLPDTWREATVLGSCRSAR